MRCVNPSCHRVTARLRYACTNRDALRVTQRTRGSNLTCGQRWGTPEGITKSTCQVQVRLAGPRAQTSSKMLRGGPRPPTLLRGRKKNICILIVVLPRCLNRCRCPLRLNKHANERSKNNYASGSRPQSPLAGRSSALSATSPSDSPSILLLWFFHGAAGRLGHGRRGKERRWKEAEGESAAEACGAAGGSAVVRGGGPGVASAPEED